MIYVLEVYAFLLTKYGCFINYENKQFVSHNCDSYYLFCARNFSSAVKKLVLNYFLYLSPYSAVYQ